MSTFWEFCFCACLPSDGGLPAQTSCRASQKSRQRALLRLSRAFWNVREHPSTCTIQSPCRECLFFVCGNVRLRRRPSWDWWRSIGMRFLKRRAMELPRSKLGMPPESQCPCVFTIQGNCKWDQNLCFFLFPEFVPVPQQVGNGSSRVENSTIYILYISYTRPLYMHEFVPATLQVGNDSSLAESSTIYILYFLFKVTVFPIWGHYVLIGACHTAGWECVTYIYDFRFLCLSRSRLGMSPRLSRARPFWSGSNAPAPRNFR